MPAFFVNHARANLSDAGVNKINVSGTSYVSLLVEALQSARVNLTDNTLMVTPKRLLI